MKKIQLVLDDRDIETLKESEDSDDFLKSDRGSDLLFQLEKELEKIRKS